MIAPQDILHARDTIRPHVFRTPLRESFLLSERVGASVYLKLENWQITGSFKLRGALNRMARLTDAEGQATVNGQGGQRDDQGWDPYLGDQQPVEGAAESAETQGD